LAEWVNVLNQEKLLKVIDADLRTCDSANSLDERSKLQHVFEHIVLVQHRQWACEAGDDQAVLEQIVQSLEKNIARHRHWREKSTA
jgi:hypothetical protein